MGMFNVNDEDVPLRNEGDERFKLLSTLISTPETLSSGAREFAELERLIRKDFLSISKTVGMPGESEIYANLLTLLDDLHELVEFPYLANKNIVAVGGEFSAGKSRFLNAVFGAEDLLPTDPNPTTAIPTYLIRSDRENIFALNSFNRTQVLTREELNAISHGFNRNQTDTENRISFYHILRLLQVQSPLLKWENIAFLDTPGYSKPKENIDDEAASVGTEAGNTDEQKACEHLSTADYLVWVVSAADGTFQQPGIEFLRDKVKWSKPLYLLVNKADQRPRSELDMVFKQICSDARNAGFNLAGASAYSSRECKVYCGDDPSCWFTLIDGRLKLTKWRGRFKEIISKVLSYCDSVETRCSDYGRMLARLQLQPDIENDRLFDKVAELRKGLSDEAKKRKEAKAQISLFIDKTERRLDILLKTIGVVEETASDVGTGIVAVGTLDESMTHLKKGDKLIGTVEYFSRFLGCYLRSTSCRHQIQIRRTIVEKVTDSAQLFTVGRQFELTVYDVNYGQGQVTFNVAPF